MAVLVLRAFAAWYLMVIQPTQAAIEAPAQ